MVPVARYLGRTNSFGLDVTADIVWPERGVGNPPPDTPECGFDGSLCDKSNALPTSFFLKKKKNTF